MSRDVYWRNHNVPIIELKFPYRNVPWVRNLGTVISSLNQLKNFDIIHSHYYPAVLAGGLAETLWKIPHIFTFHGFAPLYGWQNSIQTLKMVEGRIGTFLGLRRLDHVITVSNFLKRILIESYFYRGNISIIPNGVDIKRFNPKVDRAIVRKRYNLENAPLVLFLGRLVPYKGVRYLLEAVPYVLREVPNVKFMIAGAPRYEKLNYQRQVEQMGLRASVLFAGFIAEEELSNCYAACDIFCFPSLWEGFGLPAIEAMACEKPVVAFRDHGVQEIVEDGKTGSLAEPRNVKELAEAIINLLQDENLRRKMGQRGREKVIQNYTWDIIAEKTLKLYENLLELKLEKNES